MKFFYTVMCPKDADGMANSVDHESNCFLRSSLIWDYTVCPGPSVQIVRIIMVDCKWTRLKKTHCWRCATRQDSNKHAQLQTLTSLLQIPLTCTGIISATSWENLFTPYENNKGADQPAHLRSLINAFVICCLDGIVPLVSISEVSSLYLASLAAEAGLSQPWLQSPKTGFLVMRLTLFMQWITKMLIRLLYRGVAWPDLCWWHVV